MVKFKAYVAVTIPVEFSIDDEWKKMEKYADTPFMELTHEQDDWYADNDIAFKKAVVEELTKLGYGDGELQQVFTMAGNNAYDIVFE